MSASVSLKSASAINVERFTHTAIVAQVTDGAIGFYPPTRGKHTAWDWIPKRAILDCDSDLDEVEVDEEITIEIPLRLAREKGLAE